MRHEAIVEEMTRRELTVLVIEDEPWVRENVVRSLTGPAGGFKHGQTCRTLQEAEAWVRSTARAEVALVDLTLPDGGTLELIATLRAQRPEMVIVAFVSSTQDPQLTLALRAGADGYLVKEMPLRRIGAALLEALDAGQGFPLPRFPRTILRTFRPQHGRPGSGLHLTPREKDVLTLLAKGMSYEEAGHTLGIRLGTIQSHVKRIYGRLEVNTKAEAALAAAQLGLV
jgi:DNA-binding NarL/FixJ family response regulator